MTVLVIGATGRTASHLASCLVREGLPARGLVRNAEKAAKTFAGVADGPISFEIVSGPFDDDKVLTTAFAGVEIAFLALGTSPDQIRLEKGLIDAARRVKEAGEARFGGALRTRRPVPLADLQAACLRRWRADGSTVPSEKRMSAPSGAASKSCCAESDI